MILVSLRLESVVHGLEVFWKISAMMGLAFWIGLFWRRTTSAGAWAGTLAGFTAYLFTGVISLPWGLQRWVDEKGVMQVKLLYHNVWDFNAQFADKLPDFMLWEGKLYLPWQMILYLGTGLIVLVVVSLLTKPVPREQLERFYACLRTPVGPDEPETRPFELPPGVEPAPRRVLVDIPGFEFPMPTRVSVLGVLGATAAVVAFIFGVYWVFSLGA